jgi:hypothetical protein
LAQLAFGRAKQSFESELTLSRGVGDDHRQHALCTSIPATLEVVCVVSMSLPYARRTPAEHAVNLLSTVPCYGRCHNDSGDAHSFVQMHAPDQTASRPQLLHCRNDLTPDGRHLIGRSETGGGFHYDSWAPGHCGQQGELLFE